MKDKAFIEGITIRVNNLKSELELLMNEPSQLYSAYKGRKITRLKADIKYYEKMLDLNS